MSILETRKSILDPTTSILRTIAPVALLALLAAACDMGPGVQPGWVFASISARLFDPVGSESESGASEAENAATMPAAGFAKNCSRISQP